MAELSQKVLEIASKKITALTSQTVELIEVNKPSSPQSALHLAKIVSKLSPLLGNFFEFRIVEELNEEKQKYGVPGNWVRQDPGFPDAKFESDAFPEKNVGVEIKAWFPLSTEITGRFKDSESAFIDDSIKVAIIAWLPEYVFWGKPVIIKTLIVSGKSIAIARDTHYHNPPHYIVFEPEDTTNRTGNLQQTNTNGYVFQDENTKNRRLFDAACKEVNSWGESGKRYRMDPAYQRQLKTLLGKYPYRQDTNYAKIDRIQHAEIESFKECVLKTLYRGKTIQEWNQISSLDITDARLIAAINDLMR